MSTRLSYHALVSLLIGRFRPGAGSPQDDVAIKALGAALLAIALGSILHEHARLLDGGTNARSLDLPLARVLHFLLGFDERGDDRAAPGA